MSSVAVRMRGINKSFGGIRVLDQVDFELRTGEIHALLGENGAGKSTLMKILRGVYTMDSGEIEIDGAPVHIGSSKDARSHGVAMVFQEFSLIPTLTVAQNICLNREPRTALGFLDDRAAERRARLVFDDMEVHIDPHRIVGNLSTGNRQLTEIATALSQEGRILILDEPTASLTRSETDALFAIMRRLKAKGISMIYISHRMEEIFQIADRITVLRDGHRIVTGESADLTVEQVIEYIIGRKSKSDFSWQQRSVERTSVPLLEAQDLTSPPTVRGMSFKLYPGEVVGLVGLMGSGRTELVETIFGIRRVASGRLHINGNPLYIRHPEHAIRNGIALIPEDRRTEGLVLGHTIKHNLLLPLTKLRRLQRPFGLIDERAGNRITAAYIDQLNIRTPSMYTLVRLLSGGNQQKVVIAKWLSTDPDILLLDEPMAGVDVGTKGEILDIIRALAEAGKGIVLISSELPELLAVSDRVLIVKDGQIVREILRKDIETEESLHHILQGAKTNE